MIKRILSLVVSVFMLMTLMFIVPVSAETALPSNIGTDYVPGEITGNVITTENLATGNGVASWSGGAIGTVNGEAAWQVTTSSQVPDTVGNSNAWGVLGRLVSNNGYDRTSVYEAGKNVVLSYQAKVDTGSPVMKAALYQYSKTPIYAKEYPGVSDGVTVTNTDWQTYSHTFVLPATGFMGAGNTALCIGLAYTGTSENRRGYWIKGGSVYLGKEYAYDFDVTADKTELLSGESAEVTATVLNQGGVAGGLTQGAAWYALNSDRTAVADGITITEGANGKATVTISSSVESGTYCIVAVADADENMVKGIQIEVTKKSYEDFVPDTAERDSTNMVTPGSSGVTGNAWSGTYTFGFNGAGGAGGMSYGNQSGNEYYFKNLSDADATINNDHPVIGFNINTVSSAGKTGRVVYSFDARANSTPKAVINLLRLNTGVASTSASHVEYPEQYNGADKGVVPTTSTKTYAGSFADKGVLSEKYRYRFGFAKGTATNAVAYFDASTMYIGYEYLYDITVKADRESVAVGKTITVDADVVNQVGLTNSINQGVTWHAMNTDRSEFVEGFTFAEGENGIATVTVDTTVPYGSYDLVAVADADDKLVKGVTIEVTEPASPYEDYIPGPLTDNKFTGFSNMHASGVNYSNNGETLTLTTSGAVGDGIAASSSERGAYGAGVSSTGNAEVWIPGKTIVFGAKAKAGTGIPRVKFAVWQSGYPARLPDEEPGITDGTVLSADDWQQISYTMPLPTSGIQTPGNVILGFGFTETPAGETEAQRSVIVDISSVYLGIEAAHDISVSIDKTDFVSGEAFNVDADILNQIGSTGTLSQNVTWQVMDSERKITYTDGFTITPGADGKATVLVDPFVVQPGSYDIVAYSSEFEMARGVTINVPETNLISALTLSDFSNGTVSATASIKVKDDSQINAIMIVFMVNEKNQITDIATAQVTGVSSVDGKKDYELSLAAVNAENVKYAKALLLDCGTQALPTVLNSNLNELAPALVVEK